MRQTRAIFLVLSVISTIPAFAEEGRIPIFEPIDLDGTTSDISGRYVVTRDITAPNGSRAIRMVGDGTEEIEIDLNGFTITGNANGLRAFEIVTVKKIVIRNGTVKTPVQLDPLIHIDLNDQIDDEVVIEGVRFSKGFTGVVLKDVANIVFRNNTIVDTHLDGLLVFATTPGITGTIEGNIFRNVADSVAGGAAIAINGSNAALTIRNNRIKSQFAGIRVPNSDDLLIADNAVSASGLYGIEVASSTGCRLVNNAVTGSSDAGIRLTNTTSCLVRENVAYENGIGIRLDSSSSRNHIDRNVANENTTYGIHLTPGTVDNRIGRNSAVGNVGPGSCANPGVATCGAPDLCDEGANMSFGDNLVPGPGPC